MVALNHAVAVAIADGPRVGLALIDAIDGLDPYHLFHAARGELLLRAGNRAPARQAQGTKRALSLSKGRVRRLHRTPTMMRRRSTTMRSDHEHAELR